MMVPLRKDMLAKSNFIIFIAIEISVEHEKISEGAKPHTVCQSAKGMIKIMPRRQLAAPARGVGIMERALEKMDIPPNAVFRVPKMEIFGTRQMMLENHSGIMEYSEEEIKINCGKVIIRIEGEKLTLKAMNCKELSIVGSIRNIAYIY